MTESTKLIIAVLPLAVALAYLFFMILKSLWEIEGIESLIPIAAGILVFLWMIYWGL